MAATMWPIPASSSASEVNVTYTGLTDNKLTVAANGDATFTVTIQLTEAGKKYLDDNFPTALMWRGFTFLTAEDDEGVSLSVPFLGFYGDWGGLTVFDGDPGEQQNMLGTALADIDAAGSGYFVGVNNTSGAYNESKMAYGPPAGQSPAGGPGEPPAECLQRGGDRHR